MIREAEPDSSRVSTRIARHPGLESLGAPAEAWIFAARELAKDVAAMPHLLRTACALKAAGVTRVVVLGAEPVAVARVAGDGRLFGTVLEARPEPPVGEDAAPILVARGDRVFHRDAPRLLARASGAARVVADWDSLAVVSRAEARRLVAGGAPEGAVVVDPPFLGFSVPVEDPSAEGRLLLSLRKPIDGIAARTLNRHVSLWLTRRLMRTGIRPNHVSAFTMALGLAAAGVCALGGWSAALAGVLLLELGSILDGVDGELARLRYQGSRLGEWMDTISDDLSNAAWIAGVAANLAHGGSRWAWPAAAVALGCFLFSQGASYARLLKIGSGDLLAISWNVLQAGRVMRVLYFLVKRDFFVTLFVVLVAVGRLDVVLGVCVAGAVGVAVGVVAEMVTRGASRSSPPR